MFFALQEPREKIKDSQMPFHIEGTKKCYIFIQFILSETSEEKVREESLNSYSVEPLYKLLNLIFTTIYEKIVT